MFKFLKDKIKSAVNSFSKKAEKEVKEEKVEDEEIIEEAKQKEEELLEIEEEPIEEVQPSEEEKRFRAEEEKEKKIIKEKEKTQEEIKEKVLDDLEDFEEYDKTDEEIEATFKESHSIRSKEIKDKEQKSEEKKEVQEEKTKPKPKFEEKNDLKEAEEIQKTDEEIVEKTPEKKSLFNKLKDSFTKKTLSEEKFDKLFWDLEVSLLENNVAFEVIEKIKNDLKKTLTKGKVSRLGIEDLIKLSLKKSIIELFDVPSFDLLEKIQEKKDKPFKIAFIGVNGSGKTTTLAKIANLFLNNNLKVVIAASDTFRAAAIDQLEEHAHNLGIKMISQGYGADPAAVAFDAIEHAKSKGVDVVMIDTAGRLHSNTNLMVELEKVIRVAKPDLKIFIGESITGNDCVEQAKAFNEKVGIDAIILSKADVDEKGGAAISVSYVTGKPILYLGVGQNYGDLKKFDKHKIIESMGL